MNMTPKRNRLTGLVMLVVCGLPGMLAFTARASTARAACPCSPTLTGAVPSVGATGVALNSRFTLYVDRTGKARDAMGSTFDTDSSLKLDLRYQGITPMDKIDGTTSPTSIQGVATLYRFDAAQPLPAGVVVTAFATDTAMALHTVGMFTTGSAADMTPPTFAGATAVEATLDRYAQGADCVSTRAVARLRVTATAGTDDTTTAGDLRYEVSFYRSGAPSAARTVTAAAGGAGDLELIMSSAMCGVVAFESEIISGTTYCVRVKAIDAAGNHAGSMEEKCVKAEARNLDVNGQPIAGGGGGGGCVAAGAPDATGTTRLALLGLALLAIASALRAATKMRRRQSRQ